MDEKYLKFFDADPDPGSGIFLTRDPGWKKFGFGSATLLISQLNWNSSEMPK
jgi:hypothetical protein